MELLLKEGEAPILVYDALVECRGLSFERKEPGVNSVNCIIRSTVFAISTDYDMILVRKVTTVSSQMPFCSPCHIHQFYSVSS